MAAVPSKGRGIFVDERGEDIYKATKLREFDLKTPDSNEVVVKFLAAAINPSDIYCINGFYPDVSPCPMVVGFEGVGEVIAKGEAVSRLEIGDWVLPGVPKFGTWRTHCVVPETHVAKVDKSMGFQAAATVFLNPCTAYFMLKEIVDLKPGDTVMQNGANSSVGKALIQIANDKGIKTINIIRKREASAEAALKKQLQDLGADCVITDEELKKRGVDEAWPNNMARPRLVIDCVGGEAGNILVSHLQPGGTFVNYGALSGKNVELAPLDLIFRDIKAVGFWITDLLRKNPRRIDTEGIPYICQLMQQGKFKSAECELFRLDDYEEAMKRHIAGYSNLKQLLIMDESLMS